MKRILAILLAVTLLIASGCGSSAGNNDQSDNAATNNTQNAGTNDATPPDDGAENDGGEASGTENETTEPDNTVTGDSDYNPVETGFKLGNTIADFTITTYQGNTVTLSDVLREKDAVLINIFATWCGPCKNEFPFMEQAYKQLQDRIEIIALSGDSSDTAQMVRQVANSLGLTFPMGLDSAGISRGINLQAFPTTLVVDRFGTIVFFQIGSFDDTSSFLNMFEFLVSDEYTESVILNTIPPEMPHLDKISADVISEAIGSEGIAFDHVPGAYIWPMSAAEVDGRTVLVSSNQGKDRSRSAVQATVNAAAGDVFAFDLKLSSEEGFDFFQMSVNGEVVKVFSGEKDWNTFGYEFPTDGEYVIELAYAKDEATDSAQDTLWLDNVRLLSGDEAAAVLAVLPAYPVADATSFQIANENVQRVAFEDPYNIVYKIFGCPYQAYLINSLEVECYFTLAEGVDPDAATCYDNHGLTYVLSNLLSGDGYKVTFTIDSLATTGKGYTYVILDPDVTTEGEEYPIVFFADQEGLDKFTKTFAAGAWHDAEEWEKAQAEQNQQPEGDVTYTLRCVDENGAPIAGVTLQVCNESSCVVYVTDDNGECVVTMPADHYEIHVLKAPDGFAFDSQAVIEAPVEGGEVVISLKRA